MAPRAVFDTNVFVSAYGFGGNPAVLVQAAIVGDLVLLTSPEILSEVARVLADKLRFDSGRVTQVVEQAVRVAEVVRPQARIDIIQDGPDNRVLECAQAGEADWIVSGDSHLLSLERFDGTRILSPASAVALLQGRG